MSIAIKQSDDMNEIRLEGELDIAAAAELKAKLFEALESGRELCLSLDAVTSIDVTCFQLLWAAAREARSAGLKFTLTRELSQPVKCSLECMGLDGLLFGGL